MLDTNILNKYNFPSYAEYSVEWKDSFETEKEMQECYYWDFLKRTENIPIDIMEELIENLAGAKLGDLLNALFDFMQDVNKDYKDVLQARKYCKKQIQLLNN